MPTAAEYLSQSNRLPTATEFLGEQDLGGGLGGEGITAPPTNLFDPVSAAIPPVQEADFVPDPASRPIAEMQQGALEGIDEFFGVPESFEDAGAEQFPRAIARAGVGAVGFLPGLAERLIRPPEGQSTLDVAGEEVTGVAGMLGRFPFQTRLLALRGLGLDPNKALNPADQAAISLVERITGQSFDEFNRGLETGLLEAPEETIFAPLIGAGVARGGAKLTKGLQKVKDRPPTRRGEPTPEAEPFSLRVEEPTGETVKLPEAKPGELPIQEAPKPTVETKTPKEQAIAKISEDALKVKDQMKEAGVMPERGVAAEPTPERGTPVLTNARIAETLVLLEVDKLKPLARKSMMTTTEEALINRYDQDALIISRAINKTSRIPNAAEQVGAAIKIKELKNRHKEMKSNIDELRKRGDIEGAKLELERAEQIRGEILEIATAMRYGGGTGVAQSLQIRQAFVPETFEISNVLLDAETIKGKSLSKQETLKFETEVESLEGIQKELDVVTKKWQDELAKNDRLLADGLINRETRRGARTKVTQAKRGKILVERADLKKQIAALGFRLNDITGATVEGSYLIGRLALNYAREAVLTLSEVIAKVRGDFSELTEMDVIRAINTKNPALQGKARSEATKRIAQIKTQARLLEQIDKAEQGIFDAPKKRPPQPRDIKILQRKLTELRKEAYRSNLDGRKLDRALQTINELQDHLSNQHRAIKNKQAPDTGELALAKGKIKELRQLMRIEDVLADMNEQLRTGDFKVPKPRPEPPMSVQREQIRVKRKSQDIRDAQEALRPRTTIDVLGGAADFSRTMQTTLDISASARQGLVGMSYLVTDGIWGLMTGEYRGQFGKLKKAHVDGLKAMFSEFKADQIDLFIRNADHHYLREKAGLFLAERKGSLTLREEHFRSQLAEKIPAWGQVIKASNRHMTTFLNVLRAAQFDLVLEKFPNATMTELKLWADFINKGSGRGSLGSFDRAAKALSLGFFAPRFAVSRIQTPWTLKKAWKEPRIRNEIGKGIGGTVALVSSALYLAHLAGAEVSFDFRSPDVFKAKIGDQRIDFGGGFLQPGRLVARLGATATDRLGLTGRDLLKSEKDVSPLDLLYRYAAFKLGPAATITGALVTGEDAVGQPITPSMLAVRSLTPFVIQATVEGYRSSGFGAGARAAGFETIGAAVSTYSDSKSRVRRNIRKLYRAGKKDEAKELGENWNLINPDDPIRGVRINDSTVFGVSKKKSNTTRLIPARR